MERRIFLSGALASASLAACPALARPAPLAFAHPAAGEEAAPLSFGTRIDRAMLARLREEYGLAEVVAGAEDDLARVRRMSAWVRSRWEHNGSNEPSRSDPLTILAEAATGQRFRCVEYAEVLAAALSAVGVPTRVLGLQRADVETAESGAGHVADEAWLADRQAWAYVDGQWDVIPFRDERPLDAVAMQAALAAGDPAFRVEGFSGRAAPFFGRWIEPYLHYFVIHPREWSTGAPAGARDVMLAPLGAPAPRVFQRRFAQSDYVLTRSPAAFYAPPPAIG